MRKFRKFLLYTLLAAAACTLSAAAGDTLTFDDLVASLEDNNTTLLQSIEDYRTSNLDVKDAKANYHPQITYTLAGSYVYNHQVMNMSTDSIKNDMRGKTINIPFGEMNIPIGLDDIASQLPNEIDLPITVSDPYFNAQISLVQPIWTWGKVGSSVEMYEEIESARALQIGDTEKRLIAELKAYLASLYYLKEIDSVLSELQADSRELVTLAQDSSDAGALLAVDAAKARVTASQIDVSRTQIQTQMESILTSIETLTGINDITTDMIDFTPDEAYFNEMARADRTTLLAMATSGSQASMQMLEHMINAAQAASKAADRSMYWYPDIALSVSANYSAPMTSKWADNSSWGVTVAVGIQGTLWDGGKKLNDQDRAESAAVSAQISRSEAVSTIKTTLNENLNTIDLALANIDYQKANIELLTSELELEEKKLELGASSRSDVLNKRIELNQARIEEITSRISLASAVYTVEYLTGYVPGTVSD